MLEAAGLLQALRRHWEIAETLGYSPTTIERHATDSASAYGQYVAATRTVRKNP